jgi:hypothetical protein
MDYTYYWCLLGTFPLNIDSECRDMSYYTEIYQLSCQKVLEAFYDLISETIVHIFKCNNKILAI